MKNVDVVKAALRFTGIKEDPPKSNRGQSIDAFNGGRGESWCAHFVAYCFRICNRAIPGDVIPTPQRANPLANVAAMEKVFVKNFWVVAKDAEPQVGDVVFYASRGLSDPGVGRHVGLVVAVDVDFIYTVEGNWQDQVTRRKVARNHPHIVQYGRVP